MDSQKEPKDSSAATTFGLGGMRSDRLPYLAPRLLTRQQAAQYLGCSVRVLDKLSPRISSHIGYVRLVEGGDKRYPIDLLDAFIDRCIDSQVPTHLLASASLAA